MKSFSSQNFNHNYQSHLKHLKLKGLQPKTIEAYSRAIRRIGDYFNQQIDALTEAQLADYFSDLLASHSWSSVKLDLYGLKFYTTHVLQQPWIAPKLIKPPRVWVAANNCPASLTLTISGSRCTLGGLISLGAIHGCCSTWVV